MRWRIKGADANTGEDRLTTIEAASRSEAEAWANYNSILVETVERVDVNEHPAPALSYRMPTAPQPVPVALPIEERDASEQLADAIAQSNPVPPPPVNYANPRKVVPNYPGLLFGAVALRVFAYVWYIIGLLTLLAAGWTALQELSAGGLSGIEFLPLLLSICPFAAGMVFHVMAEACNALRDIARNSFQED